MSNLLEKQVDKFHNKTQLVTKQVTLWSDSKLYDYGLSGQRNDIRANFRYWSDQDGETILLDVDYGGPDWLFLREGDMVIRVNNTKNIELKPSGEDNDVHANEQHKIICHEVLYYKVEKQDFIDICEATSLEFQISGSRNFVNGNAEHLQSVGRVLYNELYGKDLPVEIEERVKGLIPLTLLITALNMPVWGGAVLDIMYFLKGYTIRTSLSYSTTEFCGRSWGVWFLFVALVVGGEVYIYNKSKKAAIFSSIVAIIVPIIVYMIAAAVS